jgi:hypothetical protein
MVRKLDVPDRINAGPIYASLVDITEDSELATHPIQEVVSSFVVLLRTGRYASVVAFHICALLPRYAFSELARFSILSYTLYTLPQ